MRSCLPLFVPVRRGLAFVALVPMLVSACAQAMRDDNLGYDASGHGGAGAGGAPSTSSGSGGAGGAGGGSCTDQCTAGARQCSDHSVLICEKGLSGCTEWGIPTPCDAGETCSGGQCGTLGSGSPLDCGYDFGCARLNDGSLKCWGKNTYGQLGLGDVDDRGDGPNEMGTSLPAVNLGKGKTPVAVSAGNGHACALLQGGGLKCWGENAGGQLGLGDTKRRGNVPNQMGDDLPLVDLGTGKTAVEISAGEGYSCARLSDGSVKCWGANADGQLGLGHIMRYGDGPNEMGDSLPTVDLGTGKTAITISAAINHACAILNDGSVKCWGRNDRGQLGLNDIKNRGGGSNQMGDNLPAVALGTGKTAVAISTGAAHTCAILNDGSVKCWGYNTFGQLGLGDTNSRGDGPDEMGDNLPAVDLGTGKIAVAIGSGNSHTCVLSKDGSVKCWGDNFEGQLALGDTNHRGDGPNEMGDKLPALHLGTGKSAVAISVGDTHACAKLSDDRIKCWGAGSAGALGQGDELGRGDGPDEMGDSLPPVSL